VQISPPHLNLQKFLTTSLKIKRKKKLIAMDSRKYALKFNKAYTQVPVSFKNIETVDIVEE
jgi:hypothetical protein